jgi:hypothetical protein
VNSNREARTHQKVRAREDEEEPGPGVEAVATGELGELEGLPRSALRPLLEVLGRSWRVGYEGVVRPWCRGESDRCCQMRRYCRRCRKSADGRQLRTGGGQSRRRAGERQRREAERVRGNTCYSYVGLIT